MLQTAKHSIVYSFKERPDYNNIGREGAIADLPLPEPLGGSRTMLLCLAELGACGAKDFGCKHGGVHSKQLGPDAKAHHSCHKMNTEIAVCDGEQLEPLYIVVFK